MTDMKWFTDKDKWNRYVKKHMANGVRKETSIDVVIRAGSDTVIAKWNIDGCGQVFERRTVAR